MSNENAKTTAVPRPQLMRLLGTHTLVFDAEEWMETGDIGDNSQFWKRAEILGIRLSKDGREICDVRFDDERISMGHFLSGIQKCAQHVFIQLSL